MRSIASSIVVLAGAVVILAGAVSTTRETTYETLISIGAVIMLGGAVLFLISWIWGDKRD